MFGYTQLLTLIMHKVIGIFIVMHLISAINEYLNVCSAKDYMETTEGENWASNLINHLNTHFPNSVSTAKVSVFVPF